MEYKPIDRREIVNYHTRCYLPTLTNIHRHAELYLAYKLTSLFAKFSLPTALPVWFTKLKFPCQIFPMYGILQLFLLKIS